MPRAAREPVPGSTVVGWSDTDVNSERRSPLTARRVYRVTARFVLVVLASVLVFVAIRWLLSGSPFAALGFLFGPTGWDIASSILPFEKATHIGGRLSLA